MFTKHCKDENRCARWCLFLSSTTMGATNAATTPVDTALFATIA